MKFRDLDGQFKDIVIKTGDTLPVGSVVEYEGSTPPAGWSKLSDGGSVIVSSEEPTTGEEVWFQTSRNLFDRSNITQNTSVDNNTGGVYEDTNSFTTNYIPVSPGKTYKFNGLSSSAGRFWGALYDSSKNYIGKIDSRGFPKNIFISDTNAGYMRLGILNIYMDNFIIREANDKIHTKNDNGVYEEFYNEEEHKEFILFDGEPTTGEVSLKDSVSHYKYIEVFYYTHPSVFSSVKVPSNAAHISCVLIDFDLTYPDNHGFVLQFKHLINNDTTLTVGGTGRFYKYQNSNDITQDTQNQIYVSKVVGYK